MQSTSYDPKTGVRIAILRNLYGYTQKDVADKIHIDRSTYSKIEAGTKTLTIHHGLETSKLFGVSLEFIYKGDLLSLPLTVRDEVKRELFKHSAL